MRTGFIKPESLMDFFDENRQALAERYINIARDEDGSVEVDLTSANGTPCFQVVQDGIIVSEIMKTRAEAQGYYEDILKRSGFIEELTFDDDDTLEPVEYEEDFFNPFTPEQEDRLDEISCAMEDLLGVLLGEDPARYGIADVDVDELCVEFAQRLYEKYGISVNFPMEAIDADGNLFAKDYPFGEEEENYD